MEGTGPYPIISGSTPAKAKVTMRAFTVKPSSMAFSSAITNAAVAPSFRPAAFPGETRPPARNGVFNPASASMVVPGRGGSSTVAIVQPSSALRVAVGIKSF